MEVQNQVGRCLRGNLARLHDVLNSAASQGSTSLGQLADRVCDAFHLRDGRGRLQRTSCCKALGALHRADQITLSPPRRHRAGGRKPRVLAHAVPPACEVPEEVSQVRELVLVRVGTDAHCCVARNFVRDFSVYF